MTRKNLNLDPPRSDLPDSGEARQVRQIKLSKFRDYFNLPGKTWVPKRIPYNPKQMHGYRTWHKNICTGSIHGRDSNINIYTPFCYVILSTSMKLYQWKDTFEPIWVEILPHMGGQPKLPQIHVTNTSQISC